MEFYTLNTYMGEASCEKFLNIPGNGLFAHTGLKFLLVFLFLSLIPEIALVFKKFLKPFLCN